MYSADFSFQVNRSGSRGLAKFFSILLEVGLVAVSLPAQNPPPPNPVDQANIPRPSQAVAAAKPAFSNLLPEGTPVRMVMTRDISSADAQVGENVDFETLDDIKIGDSIIVPRGSIATGSVTEAIPKRRMARGGRLSLKIDFVRLPSGDKLALRGVRDFKGNGHTGAMAGGMVATAIIVWPAAPLFLLMHGKDVTIPKGQEVTVYTNADYSPFKDNSPSIAANSDPSAATSSRALPGTPLTNADIVKMKSAGLGDQLIVTKINGSPANYRLDVDDLVELKKNGIPENIIDAMIQASQR